VTLPALASLILGPTTITRPMTPASPLDTAMKAIEAQFGKNSVLMLGDPSAIVPVETIPTGAATLDRALGVGGLPRGRIVELYGPESSGKTTLTLSLLAQAQQMGLKVAFIDAEHALDPIYAKALGADPDSFIFSQPDYGEQALAIVDTLVKSGEVGVIAVDSVAALTPKAELDGEMGQGFVGLQARMMGQAMRKLAGHANRTKTLLLFTNQIRDKVGITYGSPETTPGGRALRFYASMRLDIRRISAGSDKETHNHCKVKVVKNKCAAPFKEAEFDIRFGEGIDVAGCLLDCMLEDGRMSRAGAYYELEGQRVHGREAARQLVLEAL
jgi:recombination protein RecA